MREGFRGPVFIQGDHFQVNAKKYAAAPGPEVDAVKALAREAIAAGFYNIDIDTSTLVDISKPDLDQQQKLNYEVGVDILETVRELEPEGVTISVGGEIGEVGPQQHGGGCAPADGLARSLPRGMEGRRGLGAVRDVRGGVVLADGSIADVKLDLDTLERLSKVARDEYGLAGAVQHGASTLPDSAFHNFPKRETAEIHLATNFQNMLFDLLPGDVRDEVYNWLRENAKDERKATDSDEHSFYKTRKKRSVNSRSLLGPARRREGEIGQRLR
jgi:fructose/tagatose bisphosphate aldolase